MSEYASGSPAPPLNAPFSPTRPGPAASPIGFTPCHAKPGAYAKAPASAPAPTKGTAWAQAENVTATAKPFLDASTRFFVRGRCEDIGQIPGLSDAHAKGGDKLARAEYGVRKKDYRDQRVIITKRTAISAAINRKARKAHQENSPLKIAVRNGHALEYLLARPRRAK